MDLLKAHTKLKYHELQTPHWGFLFIYISASTSLLVSREINPESLNNRTNSSPKQLSKQTLTEIIVIPSSTKNYKPNNAISLKPKLGC